MTDVLPWAFLLITVTLAGLLAAYRFGFRRGYGLAVDELDEMLADLEAGADLSALGRPA